MDTIFVQMWAHPLPWVSLVATTTGYALLLAWMKRSERWDYEPDYTDMTVVIGNAIIGVHAGWIGGWDLFWMFLALNSVAGMPILIWREIERRQRRRERKELGL